MGNKKFEKPKLKRKKGKKFIYKNPEENKLKEIKKNPFEEYSQKKFMKHGKQYKESINEYNQGNHSSSFIDRRIGQHSKHLSQDEKMKLRFKAQQLINLKAKKNKFASINDEDDLDNGVLTHRGMNINELSASDIEKSEDEGVYEKLDNYMEEMDNNTGKLSRKEIIKNIINKSKTLKLERKQLKEENREKIKLLDDGFNELSSLLKKRQRSFNKFNDEYDKQANKFMTVTDKTHPTERLKTEKEILLEKEKAIGKKNKRKEIEENISEEEAEENNNKLETNIKLSKRERIEKLIAERLSKSSKILKEDLIDRNKGDEENEDNMSDLDEFGNENNEENEDDEYYEEGEDEGGEYEDDEEDNEENEQEEEN